MLSKISIAINVILLILVINLYLPKNEDIKDVQEDLPGSVNKGNSMRIAFLNTDSLDVHYQYTIDIVESLKVEMDKKQRRLERKATKLQQEFDMLQQQARTMTPTQLQAAQQRAIQMEQEINVMQNDLANEFSEEQAILQMNLINRLDSFLIRFNEKALYDYIIKKHNGSDILIANESHDITAEVLELLNKEYLGEDNNTDSL